MQEHALVIGGFEPVYMKKLALYLGGRFGERVRVGIAGSGTPAPDADTVWIGSEKFLCEVRRQDDKARCILLTEEAGDESAVYRYQSCEKLYQQIIFFYRQYDVAVAETPGAGRGRWIVLTTDEAASDLLAFSLTCAQILGERGRTLYLNFSECSGMEELLLADRGVDFGDLASALQREEPVCIEAFVRQMEQFDYIMPPANPMILHELRENDIERLIQALGVREGYEHIVTALGTTCCGCEHFFRRAKQILHLTRKDGGGESSRKEWKEFISLCLGSAQIPLQTVCLPQIYAEGSGQTLIRTWREGALGQLAQSKLDGKGEG